MTLRNNTIIVISFLLVNISILLGNIPRPNPINNIADSTVNYARTYVNEHKPHPYSFQIYQQMAHRFLIHQYPIKSYFWLKEFQDDFPEKSSDILKLITYYEQQALMRYPDSLAIKYYMQYINENLGNENGFIAFKRFLGTFINNKKWDEAINLLNDNKKIFPDNGNYFDKLIDILKRPEENLIINNLGTNINTYGSEWDPNPTPDSKFLYFSADNRVGGYGESDIWVSELIDGKWSKAVNVGPKINGKKSETIDNISSDGNTIMLSGTFPSTFGNFDIFSISRDENGWGSLYHYPFPINSEYTDEAGNLTNDKKALLFSTDRPGGIGPYSPFGQYYKGDYQGNMDIYVSLKTEDGWSEPINLGEIINTPYAERSPYLHPDGKTLYFSSDGHPGLGGLDVFKSVRLDDSWTNWSEPQNLGKELNTILNDWGYKITVNGDSAFFSAADRIIGYGGLDLYSVKLPKDAKPEPVVTIAGRIIDENGKSLFAEVKWEDLETGEILGESTSNPYNGQYFIILPLGKFYGYFAEKEGYFPGSGNIDTKDLNAGESIKMDIVLSSLKSLKKDGKAVVVNNIFFDFAKSELKKESINELKRVINFLKNNNINNVKLLGHTDNIGNENTNLQLSKKRAQEVANYLIENHKSLKISSIEGLGSKKPIDNNNTEQGRAKNRRVELIVIE